MPKIKLEHVLGGSHYCSERLSVGVYVKNNNAVLIDSGIDDDTAKNIDKALKEKNIKVVAIINTHSHADHCGGNHYFQKNYPGLKIYSTRYEQHFIEDTINEPRCFCMGAEPCKGLVHKHLKAENSKVTNTIEPYVDQEIVIEGEKFSIITLPGHSPGMIGVISPDKVLYTGDAIFGKDTFEKHGVLFYTHIEATLKSFDKIAGCKVDATVYYHGGLYKGDLKPVVEEHRARLLTTKKAIYDMLVKEPLSLDELTRRTMQLFKIPENITQFTLTQTCVFAYVTELEREKKVLMDMFNGMRVIGTTEAGKEALAKAGKAEQPAPQQPVHSEAAAEIPNSRTPTY